MVDKYAYRIQWSEEDTAYICGCLEFPGLLAHGSSQEEALRECKRAVRGAIRTLKHDGEAIPDPIGSRKFPTSFPLRLPEDVRRELELEAAEHSMSLNQWITKKLKGA